MTATDATSDAADPPADFGPLEGNPSESAKPRKSTNAVVAGRVEEILRIRLDGAAFADIRDYAGQNGWGLSDSQLKKLIRKSDELLKERDDRSRARAIRLHVARRESLYARSVAAADYRTALAVLADDAKLRGLYLDEKALKANRQEQQRLEAEMAEIMDILREHGLPPRNRYVEMLNGLSVEDRAELARTLRKAGYNPGPIPNPPDPFVGRLLDRYGYPPADTPPAGDAKGAADPERPGADGRNAVPRGGRAEKDGSDWTEQN